MRLVTPEGSTSIAGKVAIVTGASRGIGAATARALGAAGATVLLVARDAVALTKLSIEVREAGGSAIVIPADLSETASIDHVAAVARDELGRVDLLVNNAGVLPAAKRLDRVPLEEWERVLALNLSAPWYLSCRAKELMSAGGVIVNIASTAAYYPSRGLGTYCVSKAALVMLTRACALEWAHDGVRVVGVVPGKVDTEMVRPILDYVAAHDLPLNPLGRVGTPEEIARLIVFLMTQEASFITGSLIAIDGGELISAGVTN
jgi:3-oxoacyl-[acyl-carrier protein] reductase